MEPVLLFMDAAVPCMEATLTCAVVRAQASRRPGPRAHRVRSMPCRSMPRYSTFRGAFPPTALRTPMVLSSSVCAAVLKGSTLRVCCGTEGVHTGGRRCPWVCAADYYQFNATVCAPCPPLTTSSSGTSPLRRLLYTVY
eukprot:3939446-Rhodomonas_salina.1